MLLGVRCIRKTLRKLYAAFTIDNSHQKNDILGIFESKPTGLLLKYLAVTTACSQRIVSAHTIVHWANKFLHTLKEHFTQFLIYTVATVGV
jgi:hypothetical protein